MSKPPCAYCRRHGVERDWQPFCSERCKLADLGHWLTGDYRVAGDPLPEADPDASPDDDL
ncbi:MAG TPA: DNA gyrase inhibitor YacG [Vicinamibacterales bacterium]|nr:DNA gyrase inhibitor YacG [Vicinamibacterales bacterium]